MDKQKVKELALANGFKLKQQPDGSEDLNPYVYEFAAALAAEAISELRFPAMLRQMWSGGQVQEWLSQQAAMRREVHGFQHQIDTGMVLGVDANYAVCLKDGDYYGWLFNRHPDGQWVTVRLALPAELEAANLRWMFMTQMLGIEKKA